MQIEKFVYNKMDTVWGMIH